MDHDRNSPKNRYLSDPDESFNVVYGPDLEEVTSGAPFLPSASHHHATSSSRARDSSERNSHAWTLFQDAAANASKLYQARASGRDGHWLNLQNAASSITLLYKESLEQQQRGYDAGFRSGVEKAYSELVEWLVRDPRYHSRKHIRTEDLLSFIYSPKNPAAFAAKIRAAKAHERINLAPPMLAASSACGDHHVADLEAFRDALSVSSLNGAMSHSSINRSPPRHCASHSASPPRSTRPVDLHAFVTEEFRRHKRGASSAFDSEEDAEFSSDFKRIRFSPPK